MGIFISDKFPQVIFMHNKVWEPPSWKSIFLIDAHLGEVEVRFICTWQPLDIAPAHQLWEEGSETRTLMVCLAVLGHADSPFCWLY